MSGTSPIHSSGVGVGVGVGVGIGIGIGGGNANTTTVPAAVLFGGGSDDNSAFQFPTDLISAQDHKDEAVLVLKAELMASLQKEVKSLDEDSWKFAGPRSQIHLISRPGEFSTTSRYFF
ncbi:hypothetical protein AQUCO_00500534v1 [Aquilegia coerulea]|uniref:Protein SAMBA n=1 Tax=Aquilegia coerulea TaxID=218851 RepID=A0A2G5ESE5_AQUCA|nr:hypothetical protein AQUCO_00500534v1 [Aquilegia coerulea]